MLPIIVVPFASEVHGKEYYVGIYDVIKNYLSRYGVEIHKEIITEYEEAVRIGKKYSQFLPIAIVLTGGTSKLIEGFVDSGNIERILMLSHSEHNSLASAISARNKIERKGGIGLIYHCPDITGTEFELIVKNLMKIAKSISTIVGCKIGIVVDRETKNDIEETFEAKFNASIHIKTFNQIFEEMNKYSENKVEDVKKHIEKVIKINGPDEHLNNIARLYLALKDFVISEKLDAVTIDCFPFILKKGITPCIPLSLLNSEGIVAGCEADVSALLGLILARTLSNRSGWIANVVDVTSNRCVLAHCTIALDIAKNVKAESHFESGKPYAVLGEYYADTVTILSIDRDFTTAVTALARILSTGAVGYLACRTQTVLEFDYRIEFLPNVAPHNHHVVIQGDQRKELTEVLYALGLDIIDYKEYRMYGYV